MASMASDTKLLLGVTSAYLAVQLIKYAHEKLTGNGTSLLKRNYGPSNSWNKKFKD